PCTDSMFTSITKNKEMNKHQLNSISIFNSGRHLTEKLFYEAQVNSGLFVQSHHGPSTYLDS
ncbi:hypothetical protein, partial [Acinetobacter baumannii]|uniref:hypothetical protein n=1 Tax=Acinetobacter baumannii TaxID=470 RepID=UPI001C06584B